MAARPPPGAAAGGYHNTTRGKAELAMALSSRLVDVEALSWGPSTFAGIERKVRPAGETLLLHGPTPADRLLH